uniref:Transcription factor GTE4 n=1 Tax=Noccaea caerulescens TaxID=107243 RepID=A0A1J3K762_NOCCA
MASEPVNGEGIDGTSEKRSIKVYTRKGKGKRKHTPVFAVQVSGATDNRQKPEGRLENEKDNNNHVNPPETLARESMDPIAGVKNSVEESAPEIKSQEDVGASIAKNSAEASSENLPGDDSDKVIDKPLVEAFSQDEPQDDANLVATDKNVIQPVPDPLRQDDVDTIERAKSVEVPSQCPKTQDDVNTVVVDENSIKEPPKSLAQEDVTTVIVDKNPIEAPSQGLSVEDVNTDIVVDKNPIEVSSEEYVHVVDSDNLVKEAHPENLVERDPAADQQPAGLTSDSAQNIHASPSEGMPMEEDVDGRIRIHVPSKSKQQKEEIRKKLEDQLNVVRGLVKKIEDKEGEIGAYNDSRVLVNAGIKNGGGRILSGFASAGLPREVIRAPRPLNQLSISVLENTQGVNEHVEKEKRTPKANQFYRTSEFLLGDKLPPAESNKKSKSSAKKQGGEAGHGFGAGSKVYKNCSALLERLMKHKHGWVFNAPVDVKGLGLHDYFTIIEHPMDLGTVKSALTKNMYKSPREFAEDVRLTFHNAMTYNPEGQDVHVMAAVLLQMFEERWAVIEADYSREMRFVTGYEMNLPNPTMRSRLGPTMPPPPINVRNTIDRADWGSRHADLQHPKPTTTPGRTPTSTTPSGRAPALKKPKANEPNKRDMTYEEKQKLSGHLQNLPPDKLDAIVQIVNKRNTAVKLRDEEIEVDIDSVDPETLWELDRFVTNYKKGLSKKKRKAELANQARAEAERNNQQQMASAPVAREFSREGGNTAKKTLPTPLHSQVEKQNNETSRSSSSSSSSSGSSSSSDSDSDSSSSSGSDQT